MSNDQALTIRPDDYLPSGNDLQSMLMVADHVAKSGISPHKTASAVLSVMLTGIELGIKPMAAQRLINVINGRTSVAAELVAGMIQRDHGGEALYYETPKEKRDQEATYSYRRKDWPAGERREYTFTMEMAKRAGLSGGNWSKSPEAMLRARCITAIGRIAFADTTLGMLSDDEAAEIAPEPAVNVTPQPATVTLGNGKQADVVTGVIVDDSPAIGTPVNAPSQQELDHANLLADVYELLADNPEANEKVKNENVGNYSVKRLEAMKKRLLELKSQREAAELVPPLTEAEKIELAINSATTTDELEAVVQRIADLPDGPEQYKLVDLQRQKWESLEDLPAFTAV